ncbi:MAG: outer membrane protein [Acidobacteriales bacterium]|nr:outer membrane protein [Terriglobales bacterium]
MKNIFALFLVAVLAISVGCSKTKGSESRNSSSSDSQAATGMGGGDNSQSASNSQLSDQDRSFIMNAAKGGKAEVELGSMANQQGANSVVKQFGQKMVTDHTDIDNRLQQIAQQKGVTLPTDLPEDAQSLKQQLSQAQGQQFDRSYMQNMVQDHQKDIAEFQKEASQGQDPDVKNFATTTLPILQEHLQLAQSALKAVGSRGQ